MGKWMGWALAAVLLVGCGDSGSEESATSESTGALGDACGVTDQCEQLMVDMTRWGLSDEVTCTLGKCTFSCRGDGSNPSYQDLMDGYCEALGGLCDGTTRCVKQ